MSTLAWLSAATGIITALGAVGAAIAAGWLLIYARRQTNEMLEARYAQSQPLVIPMSSPPVQSPDGIREDFNPHAQNDRPRFRNIGPGPALNVWAVIFGPGLTLPSPILPQRRTVIVGVPIAAGTEDDGDGAVGRTVLDGSTTLDGNHEHTLYAPPEPTQGEVMLRDTVRILARYTITYRDIFGRNHASIFDFDFLHRWHCVGFIPNIPRDLEEMNRERHRAMMDTAANPAQFQRHRIGSIVRHVLNMVDP